MGGLGNSSKLVTDFAPCRIEVPMQSFPVSPPPMTMTSLPLALMYPPSASSESSKDFVFSWDAMREGTETLNICSYLEELHGEVDAVDFTVGNLQIARPGCSCTCNHSIILSANLVNIDIYADMCVWYEGLLEQVSVFNP